ncbi:MAG TPA: branched-chain amino acid ABC transporter ATP-binding protein/permease [Symbiobacteriaceae bacterium]|nr:branched-chain amino acid ABC transporter ATP-binding protein/permease [Symbiobacteriaceae bacterium]
MLRRLIMLATALLVGAVLLLPFVTPDPYLTVFLSTTFIYAMLSLGLQLTFGAAGMIILCQAAFYGVGAYGGALVAARLHVPFPLTIAAGMVSATLAGLVMAPIMKLKEVYFAMATISFGAIVTVLLRQLPFTGGVNGLNVPAAELFGFSFRAAEQYYYLALVALVVQYLCFRRLLASPFGMCLNAIRQNESAARACGIPVAQLQIKATAWAVAAAGAAGALMAHFQGFIAPDMFTTSFSLWVLGMVVVGGLQSMGGALVGTLALALVREYSRGFKEYVQLVYGLLLVLFMVLLPRGLWGFVERIQQALFPRHAPHRYLKETPAGRPPAFAAGTPGEPLLQTEKVTCAFGGVVALNAVDMTVRRGEIHGLIGPNGAGKTTLLNALSGFNRPTRGLIAFKGRTVSRLPDYVRASAGINRTFQSPQLFPELSVLENGLLGYYPKMRHSFWSSVVDPGPVLAEATAHAVWALQFVGLEGLLEVQAGNLSYGQKKLLEIARVLANAPELLLLDEPAAGLTPAEVTAMGGVVRRIRALGVTVLIIEHNMPLMMELCDSMTVLHFGEVIADGTPAEIRAEPAVTAAYLGEEAAC